MVNGDLYYVNKVFLAGGGEAQETGRAKVIPRGVCATVTFVHDEYTFLPLLPATLVPLQRGTRVHTRRIDLNYRRGRRESRGSSGKNAIRGIEKAQIGYRRMLYIFVFFWYARSAAAPMGSFDLLFSWRTYFRYIRGQKGSGGNEGTTREETLASLQPDACNSRAIRR